MEEKRKEEVLQAIKSRRSIRKYKKEQITDEQLNAILEAGTYAPTGMGMQSPVIVAIQKPELIEKLSKMNAAVMGSSSDPFYGAPTVLVVLADPQRGTYVEDGSLVMGTLLLAAHAVGVDSCWIHRAKEEFESEEGKELLRQWGIPENYVGIGHCILGYRDCEYPDPKPRKENYIVRV
ncbi:MAG: nitroreductase [Fusicatenibacter sp.]|nr:nitroreductase [Lachnospiraceae bacterium]MDY2938468.1 nitroreductase [Fusicatenibacter sp.]